jgi:pimeloyl-ACP methyl ester carboxylesterase
VTRRWSVANGPVSLAVVEVGDPAHPAWVVAHGVGSSSRFVVATFRDAVLGAGRRLVAFDLRGHGASSLAPDPADHHLDAHAGDLAAVVAATAGDVEVVGGISLGAHAAVRAVGARTASLTVAPRAVLACLPAWTGSSVAGHGPHAGVAAEVRAHGIPGMVERFRRDTGMPGWLRATLLSDYPRHDEVSLSAALLALDGGEAPGPEELTALPVPLAVVGWPDDPGHPLDVAERWAALAPATTLATLHFGDLEDDLGALGRAALRAVESVRGPVRS